ncbi:hypothetical protein IV203_028685 [Nitzschia inconspicua]|uniref:Uncharacterized protein n=1 Tax=Nitzschia inconspicua TaxID=303405 RepID=A0A9K3LQ25_9STRA|nr:hypothetical protein IV203_028685 [Nitzschia inconspicua]
MNTLKNDLPGADFKFGVVSYMDYPLMSPATTANCGYSNRYGVTTDCAYRLDQSLTATTVDVSNAINRLRLGNGEDDPESYTRVLYESYSDPGIV